MADIDANTPQFAAVKNWLDAYSTLDIKNVEPLISKNFTFKRFPKIPDLAEETKEVHLQVYGKLFASVRKIETIIEELIEAPGKVVLHGTAVLTTIDGTTIDHSVVAIISLVEEDGKLELLECKEFGDPEKRNAMLVHAGMPRGS